jgi:very-short-patch-repair endonuclease
MRYFAHDLNAVDPKTVTGSANVPLWWRCPECKHEWKAKVNSRYEMEDPIGCRECNPKQRSKREIRLQEELAWALEEDLSSNRRNIRCSGKSYSVDIVSEKYKLVVEYDGAYWHKDKAKMDRKKSSGLQECGWTVIRAREYPLKKLGKDDVLVQTEGSIKSVADAVLFAIGEVLELWTPRMQTYVKARKAKATHKSDAEIQKAIRKRT